MGRDLDLNLNQSDEQKIDDAAAEKRRRPAKAVRYRALRTLLLPERIVATGEEFDFAGDPAPYLKAGHIAPIG